MPHDEVILAAQLNDTALGKAYHEAALRTALVFIVLSDADRAVINRFLIGITFGNDFHLLQLIADKIIGVGVSRRMAA